MTDCYSEHCQSIDGTVNADRMTAANFVTLSILENRAPTEQHFAQPMAPVRPGSFSNDSAHEEQRTRRNVNFRRFPG